MITTAIAVVGILILIIVIWAALRRSKTHQQILHNDFHNAVANVDQAISPTAEVKGETRIQIKTCPTCQRTYSDISVSFCLADGSLLSSPVAVYTDQDKKTAFLPRTDDGELPPTQVYSPKADGYIKK